MVSVCTVPARGGRSCEHFGGYKTINRIPLFISLILKLVVLYLAKLGHWEAGSINKKEILYHITKTLKVPIFLETIYTEFVRKYLCEKQSNDVYLNEY